MTAASLEAPQPHHLLQAPDGDFIHGWRKLTEEEKSKWTPEERADAIERYRKLNPWIAAPAKSGRNLGVVLAPDEGVRLILAADLTPEPIRWAWEGWLARGKLHIIAGAPGTGKTTLCLALAATITTGARWPDGSRCTDPGNILIWSGEDDPTDTLLPRLLAMGADTERIYFVGDVFEAGKPRSFNPAQDLETLAAKAVDIGNVRLMIVDPVVNAVAGDSHKNAEVRRALQPLVTLAAKLDAVAMGVSHFSKGSQGREPVERVTGSLAFGALPRVVLAAAKVTDDDGKQRRILARAKSNIGPDDGGFNYVLEQTGVPGHPGLIASAVLWGEQITGSAREILAQADAHDDEGGSSLSEAKRFLQDLLADGPVSSKVVRRDAEGAGLTWATVRRAQKALGVQAEKSGMQGGWVWTLPRRCSEDAEDAQAQKVSAFGEIERLPGSGPEEEVF